MDETGLHPSTLSATAIRELRGSQSRAAFARQVGVTPQTVYRWELPDGAPEARRPRGVELEKLLRLRDGSASTHPPLPPEGPSWGSRSAGTGAEGAAWLSIERVLRGEVKRGQSELLELLTRRSPGREEQALGAVGVALVEVLARSDGRGAMVALGSVLADVDALPGRTRAYVLATAAAAYAMHDARLFDLGRVHACAGALDDPSVEPEAWFIGWLGVVQAAILVGDQALLGRAFRRLNERPLGELPALLALHREEARGLELLFSGQGTAALAQFEATLERAEALGSPVLQARMMAHLSLRRLEALASPESALAMARRSLRLAQQARLAPGPHTTLALRGAAEALVRLGRFDEVEQVLAEAEEYREQTGLEPALLGTVQGRLYFLRGDHEGFLGLRDRLRACRLPDLQPLYRGHAALVEAMHGLSTCDDPQATVAAFEQAEREGERWLFLLREALIYGVAARVIAHRSADARLTLRRAQRVLDQAPSPWGSALLERFEGILLASEGDWTSARQRLDVSAATLALASDRTDSALTRYTRAVFARFHGEDGASERLDACAAELHQLGIRPPVALDLGLRQMEARRAQPSGDPAVGALGRLVVPFQRLAVRGVSAPLLLRELAAVMRELWPGRDICMEELDSQGHATVIEGHTLAGATWSEFGDGSGRRLRAGLSGASSPDDRAALSLLSATAGLALEVATMRGLGPATPHDDFVEIPGLVAASPVMRRLCDDLARLATSRSTVILTGESGSGKEVLASALHRLSPRSARPYIAFNCATVPPDLFEGQLFGHRKGAFTGATGDQPGVIRAADGGTLFLDEIGELPLSVQPKLLRFLENGEVFPLGAQRSIKVDVRVIAATHRDLAAMVRQGEFREDLYYRLQVVPVRVPPLRERREDILPLARFFLRQLSNTPPALAPDAQSALLAHPWPGNARELRNLLERTVAYAPQSEVLGADQLRF